MTEEKIYFYRDTSVESQEAKKVLDNNHIFYEEIFATSDRELPCIISPSSAVPFNGYEGVILYVSFFGQQKKNLVETR